MRIAYSIGIAKVPPTYFAVAHAEAMANTCALFGLVLEKNDPTLKTPFYPAVPSIGGRATFRQREYLEPLHLGRLSRMIRKFHPELIHHHFAVWTLPAVRAARIEGVPLVLTMHGFDVFTHLSRPSTWMQRWHYLNFERAVDQASEVLAVSKFLAGKAREGGVPQRKLQVHYQGIDTNFFTPARPTENERPVLLHVGALKENKGIASLLEASVRLADHYPHQLQLVGTGPLEPLVREAARAHPHIHYLGPTSREGVRAAMRKADIFVLACQKVDSREEAAGLVALEAQSCATPVLVNRSGGAPEMLVEGETGLIAERGNTDSLTRVLAQFLAMAPAERAEMGQRGRQFVVKERSLANSCRQLDQIYSHLL